MKMASVSASANINKRSEIMAAIAAGVWHQHGISEKNESEAKKK
jgi:hypothetical protein